MHVSDQKNLRIAYCAVTYKLDVPDTKKKRAGLAKVSSNVKWC